MEEIIKKAKTIRLVIFDVDGVLTSGKLCYGPNGLEYKEFHVHDGQGMKYLQKTGVQLGIITACKSKAVAVRMKDLGIDYVYQDTPEKQSAFTDLKQKLNLDNQEIAYVGDDLPDLPLIKQVGLGITVPNAPLTVRQHADWVTESRGGEGAVREVCELIMHAQGTYETILNSYLSIPVTAYGGT